MACRNRIIALILSLVMCFTVFAIPASATPGDAVDYVIGKLWDRLTVKPFRDFVSAFLADGKTPETATDADWQDAYSGYVNSIRDATGTTTIDASGGFYIPLLPTELTTHFGTDAKSSIGSPSVVSWTRTTASYRVPYARGQTIQSYVVPVTGYYTYVVKASMINGKLFVSDTAPENSLYTAGTVVELAKDGVITDVRKTCSFSINSIDRDLPVSAAVWSYLHVVPSADVDVSVGVDSRPGSLVGITYGYQDENGDIVVYTAQDSGMFNEIGGYLYNPITHETYQAESWFYDYENRRYDITLSGNQGNATLEYGDDGARITIIDSGNVTNVYNYYYMVPKDDPVDPPPTDPPVDPTPKPCTHSYTSAVTELPTCLIPGVRSYICMLCGDTYSEPVAAIGHIWVVRETVNASYDDNGNLLQAGYTIYKCSKCGTEHKDTADVGPPGNGSGGGGSGGGGNFPGDSDLPDIPGSSDDEGGFSIFDLVGKIVDALWSLVSGLFSTIFGGVVQFFFSLVSGISNFFGAFKGQDGVFGFATYGGADIWD